MGWRDWFRRRPAQTVTAVRGNDDAARPTIEADVTVARETSDPDDNQVSASRRHHGAATDQLLPGLGGRRLGYDDAAEQFLAWLQAEGECGEQTRTRLKGLYARFCDERGLAWLPENKLFEALAKRAERFERRWPRPDGRRQRVTTYDIPEPRPVARQKPQIRVA